MWIGGEIVEVVRVSIDWVVINEYQNENESEQAEAEAARVFEEENRGTGKKMTASSAGGVRRGRRCSQQCLPRATCFEVYT